MSLYIEQFGDHGDSIVLLHGWGFNGEVWSSIVRDLSKHYQVTVVDLPGYGNSTELSVDSLKEMTHLVLQVVPENAHWVGWSLGGLVAMQAALLSSETIASLFLVTTNACFTKQQNWQHGVDEEIFDGFASSLQANTVQTLKRFLILQTLGIPGAKINALIMLEKIKQRPAAKLSVLTQGLQWLKQTDFRLPIKKIKTPIFVCLGERDTLVPVSIKEWWQTVLPAKNIYCIKRAGHAPFLTHPKAFLQAFNDALMSEK